jgi:hypothetical protein
MVAETLQSLNTHTGELVQQVQLFLQSNGRWSPPQGQDMQLCEALQKFQQTVSRMSNDNGGQPFSVVQNDFQQLQSQSQNIEQLIEQRAKGPLVSNVWMQVHSDLVNINQSLYSTPGFNPGNFYDSSAGLSSASSSGSTFAPEMPPSNFVPLNSGSPYYPYGAYGGRNVRPGAPLYYYGYPGFRPTNINVTENSTFDSSPQFQGSFSNFTPMPAGGIMGGGMVPGGMVPGGMISGSPMSGSSTMIDSQVMSNLKVVYTQTDKFIKDLTAFLQSKGKWPPPPGTPEYQLCQNVEKFQLQVRRLGSDIRTNAPPAGLRDEMKSIGNTSQTIDQILANTSAGSEITGRWNEVRSGMNNTYQSFFSVGGINGSSLQR